MTSEQEDELEDSAAWLRRELRRNNGTPSQRAMYRMIDASVERLSRKGKPLGPGQVEGTRAIVRQALGVPVECTTLPYLERSKEWLGVWAASFAAEDAYLAERSERPCPLLEPLPLLGVDRSVDERSRRFSGMRDEPVPTMVVDRSEWGESWRGWAGDVVCGVDLDAPITRTLERIKARRGTRQHGKTKLLEQAIRDTTERPSQKAIVTLLYARTRKV